MKEWLENELVLLESLVTCKRLIFNWPVAIIKLKLTKILRTVLLGHDAG